MDYELLSLIGGAFSVGYLFSLSHIRSYKANICHLQDALDRRERLLAERADRETKTIQAVLERLEVYTKDEHDESAGYVDRSKERVAELIERRRRSEESNRQWVTASKLEA